MNHAIVLASGKDANEVAGTAVNCAVEIRNSTTPAVTLTLAVEHPEEGRPSRSPAGEATILVVHMDAKAANDLYERLGPLIHSMDWQQKQSGERPM